MSSTSSAVTYTSVYTDSEPGSVFWGADKELSDRGSLRVIVYGYDRLPMPPVAPPSPDYIPGPEEPQTPPAPHDEDEHKPMFIQPYDHDFPHDPDFVPEPIYPEYIPLEDEHILPAEEQPLTPIISPTAESLGAESDPEEDPEEYDEDETEDDPVDYPMDGGDDGDDDDGNSSGYDADDEDEGEEEEEEEHLAPADSVVVPIDELAEVERLLAMPTPSPSPLTSLSPPSVGERLERCIAPAVLPSLSLLPFSYLPPPVDHRDGIPESDQPPCKRLCLSTLGSRYEVGESSTRGRRIDYGFTNIVETEMRHLAPQNEEGHELMFIQPHDPDFVPEPIYPEYIPLEDEHILPAEEQPLTPIISPTAESLGAESDPEEDPEEYDEDETEDDPVDYPMDGGDDGDDDDGNSSGYDADDEDEGEEEEEEEHLAPADSVVVPIDELVSPPEGT
uniref:Uncharacterized protein n=1 Tax=Tanacetum cinerariifolium TaxID=118510 RepID=A0A6L2KQA2_TANCI|nr:hypothetical protein [Tanacetum cinerariifolium]